MAITLRHDAAAVALPSSSAQRKYGQNLVLQQQQQKYAAQQAANNRLFSALQQQQPARNNWQWGGNAQQGRPQGGAIIQQGGQQRGFGLTTTVDAQKQQAADAAAQRAEIEDARKQSRGFIMDDIKNGAYDNSTANKLKQNLLNESEALGNPHLNATQMADALQKFRAERALLTANRMEPPPKPTREDELKNFLGPNYDKFKDHPWVPDGKGGFLIADVPQPAPAPPASPTEAFKAEPKTDDKYQKMAEARLMGPDNEMPQVDSEEVGADGKKKKRDMTPQEFQKAVKELKADLWNIDNTEESPTMAPDISSGAIQSPPQEASILEQSAPSGIPIAPPDPGQPPAPAPPRQPLPLSSNKTAQNEWAGVAGADQPTQMSPKERANYERARGGLPKVAPPDFGKLVESAQDEDDKAVISQVQGLVSQHADSPDIVNALNVLVSSGSPSDRVAAFKYLQSAGVDLKQMIAREPNRAEKIKGVQEKNQERFGNRRDFEYGI